MNTVQRIFKNTAALLAAQGFMLGSQVVIALLIGRQFGAEGDDQYGKFATALAYALFFNFGTSLGYTTVVIREVSRAKELAGKYYGNVLAARLFLMGIGYAILVLVVHFFGDGIGLDSDVRFLIYFLALYTASILIGDINRAIFRAFEKMEYETITVIIREALRTSLGLIAILVYEDLRLLAVAFLLPGFLDVIISMLLCRKNFIKPRLEVDWRFHLVIEIERFDFQLDLSRAEHVAIEGAFCFAGDGHPPASPVLAMVSSSRNGMMFCSARRRSIASESSSGSKKMTWLPLDSNLNGTRTSPSRFSTTAF